ncbi:MAG: KR domain-containing protein, partial [Cyanobacteria bacterium P01_H01_bin.121]
WFNTGDLGLIKAGALTITGRQKDVIIINGLNYYCHEIEAVVEALAGVEISYTAACAIRGQQDQRDRLAIFFSLEQQLSPLSDATLKALLHEIRSAVIQTVGIQPDYLIPVEPAAIPKTAIGKIQRAQLGQRFGAGEFTSILKRVDILLENANTLPSWFHRQIWRPQTGKTTEPSPTGLTLILGANLDLGQDLVAACAAIQQPTIQVSFGAAFTVTDDCHYAIAPDNLQHYRQLLAAIATTQRPITQILHVGQYQGDQTDHLSLASLERSQQNGLYSLLFLVQALAQVHNTQRPVRLLVVSRYSQVVHTTDWLDPAKATILGLLKTIPQEMPWLRCTHLDLAIVPVTENGAYVWQELHQLFPEPEVAYRAGQRLVAGLERVDLTAEPQQPIPFKLGGIYLISGGLGGIGVELSRYLLTTYQAKLILVGQTPLNPVSDAPAVLAGDQLAPPLPEGEGQKTKLHAYQELQQLPGAVMYQATDICNLDRLQQIIDQALTAWSSNQLDGIIHLAGTFHEQRLQAETPASLQALLRPKVQGTWVLHQLQQAYGGDLFLQFASLFGYFGSTAVGAYAAASRFQSAFCDYQHNQEDQHAYCLAWSLWDEIGMSQGYQMKTLSRAKGYYAMTPTQGIYSVLAALSHSHPNLLIGLDSATPQIQRLRQDCQPLQQLSAYLTIPTAADFSPSELQAWSVSDRLGQPSYLEPTAVTYLEALPLHPDGQINYQQLTQQTLEPCKALSAIEQKIRLIWQDCLNHSSTPIRLDANFFELGGTSILFMQLYHKLQTAFEVSFNLSDLLAQPTIQTCNQLITNAQQTAAQKAEVLEQSAHTANPWLAHYSPKPEARLRLFCFHPAGSEALIFRQWSAGLPPEIEVCPVQLPGRGEHLIGRWLAVRLMAHDEAWA